MKEDNESELKRYFAVVSYAQQDVGQKDEEVQNVPSVEITVKPTSTC